MSDDLVDRLRNMHLDLRQGAMFSPSEDFGWDCTLEAADRIIELEAEVAKWKESVDMATMLGESLAAEVKRLTAAAHDKGGM